MHFRRRRRKNGAALPELPATSAAEWQREANKPAGGAIRRRRNYLIRPWQAEDAFGDMDFKVAGTKDFVTALQLDTKLDGIPSQVLAGALGQAKDARLTILEVMAEAIDRPDEMSPFAPRITTSKVPVDKIGEVIGPKGKTVRELEVEVRPGKNPAVELRLPG